ncbi:hypothetical protein WAF17_22020 [Bernardetia sp. ABR2-2B]|uniref:hypothetical protein n=1 Tax=Bernardetia sp. ABR2-2B TaxID=3127472 RepID=UPI0030CC5170
MKKLKVSLEIEESIKEKLDFYSKLSAKKYVALHGHTIFSDVLLQIEFEDKEFEKWIEDIYRIRNTYNIEELRNQLLSFEEKKKIQLWIGNFQDYKKRLSNNTGIEDYFLSVYQTNISPAMWVAKYSHNLLAGDLKMFPYKNKGLEKWAFEVSDFRNFVGAKELRKLLLSEGERKEIEEIINRNNEEV